MEAERAARELLEDSKQYEHVFELGKVAFEGATEPQTARMSSLGGVSFRLEGAR